MPHRIEYFLNKEVIVTQTIKETEWGDFDEYTLEETPVIIQLRATFNPLRIWLPDTMGTMDAVAIRANARIEKGKDGKWKIESIYFG